MSARGGPAAGAIVRWAVPLVLAAVAAAGEYRIDPVAVPAEVVLEVGGMAQHRDGTIYIGTRRGDVFAVRGTAWRRFAAGMNEILGLCLDRAGLVVVSQRSELTRLHDRDGDGVVDRYETVCDAWPTVPSFHEYAYGLVCDGDGAFWGVLSATGRSNDQGRPASSHGFAPDPWRMWSFRVGPDGGFQPWSAGLRTANGIGLGPEGQLFAADNQGDWVGTSMLHHLAKDAFHGHVEALRWKEGFAHRSDPAKAPIAELSALRQPPAIYLPHGEVANSPSQPLLVPDQRFGPFAGQLILGDIVQPVLIRCDLERVGGLWQGACFLLQRSGGLAGGINRLCFLADGRLLIGQVGTGNWGRGRPGSGLSAMSWSGVTPFAVRRWRVEPGGFRLELTAPADPASSADPAAVGLRSWTYAYHGSYGSPKVGERAETVAAVRLDEDRRTLRLAVSGLQPGRVFELKLPHLRSAAGAALSHAAGWYTLNRLP